MPEYDFSQSKYPQPVVWDYLTFGVGGFVFVLLFIVNVLAYAKRRFPPIKAKQLWTIYLMYSATLIWWFSVSVVNLVLPRAPFLTSCSFWGIWGQCFFGIYLFGSVLIFRYYRIYRIVCQKKRFWKYPSLVLALLMVPALIICAILQGLQLSGFNDDPTEMCCYISLYAQIALFLVYVIYLGILIFLSVSLRKSAGGYREFIENFQILVCFAILSIFYLAFSLSGSTSYIWGRCLENLVITIAIIATYYFVLAKPLYGSIAHPEKTLDSFKESMQLHNFSSDVKQSTDKQHKKSESSFSEGINADQILETLNHPDPN